MGSGPQLVQQRSVPPFQGKYAVQGKLALAWFEHLSMWGTPRNLEALKLSMCKKNILKLKSSIAKSAGLDSAVGTRTIRLDLPFLTWHAQSRMHH